MCINQDTSACLNGHLISIFIPSLRGGGAERAMILFANELIERGYLVDLLVLSDQGPLKPLLHNKINFVNLNTPRALKSLPKLITYLKSKKPEALYCTIIHVNLISVLARFFAKSKTKIIIRESNTPQQAFAHTLSGKVSLSLLPILYPKAHSVLAVSKGVKDSLLKLSPRLHKKITIAATPVLTEEVFKLAEKPMYFDEKPELQISSPFILGAGRLHFQKDFSTLILAFNEVQKIKHDLSLVILGEGAERAALETLVTQLNLEDKVYMPGFVKNPFPFFKNAKVFVLSSIFEGMPNVLIQALALGTNCVSTDCESGPREVSENGKLCDLVPTKDVKAMASAILRNLNQTSLNSATQQMNLKYGIKNSVDEYLSILS